MCGALGKGQFSHLAFPSPKGGEVWKRQLPTESTKRRRFYGEEAWPGGRPTGVRHRFYGNVPHLY